MLEEPRSRSHGAKHLPEVREALGGVQGPVADLGCGEGIFAEVSPAYLGIDRDPAQAGRVRALGRPAAAGELLRVPLRDASCGAVLCMNVLHELRDVEGAFREIDRVLRPGGRLYVKNRWHKGGGAPASAAARLSSVLHLHRFRYWNHAWAHEAGRIHVSGNPNGTWGICPSCTRRWLERRGYAVRRPRAQILVAVKP
jgi:SAM-dependent methyltransferase